jgi:hypothetical protein
VQRGDGAQREHNNCCFQVVDADEIRDPHVGIMHVGMHLFAGCYVAKWSVAHGSTA